jgi:hypothetical protein
MSLKDIDLEWALRRLAEKRIEDAMKEGKFDNLPGAGLPLELEPMPADESARLMWWALRILKGNDIIPDEIAWRKQIDVLKAQLPMATTEKRVQTLVLQINLLAYRVNTLGTNAIQGGVAGACLQTELDRLARRKSAAHPER